MAATPRTRHWRWHDRQQAAPAADNPKANQFRACSANAFPIRVAVEHHEVSGLADLDRDVDRLFARGPGSIDCIRSGDRGQPETLLGLLRRLASVEGPAGHRDLDGVERILRRCGPMAAAGSA
jgi:hypothetical protein